MQAPYAVKAELLQEADKSSHSTQSIQLNPANHSVTMSEAHFDEYEHYNFDQDKSIHSGHSGKSPWSRWKYQVFLYSGKQRTKKEAEQNTNRHNPGGHERKIVTKLMNAEKNSNNKIKS